MLVFLESDAIVLTSWCQELQALAAFRAWGGKLVFGLLRYQTSSVNIVQVHPPRVDTCCQLGVFSCRAFQIKRSWQLIRSVLYFLLTFLLLLARPKLGSWTWSKALRSLCLTKHAAGTFLQALEGEEDIDSPPPTQLPTTQQNSCDTLWFFLPSTGALFTLGFANRSSQFLSFSLSPVSRLL